MIKHLPLVDNTDTTFLGIVPSDSLFTGEQLSDTMGITEGTLHNNTDGWLHFYVGEDATCNKTGKPYEIFISKKSLRYGISWNHINSKNGVEGKPVIANNGEEYTCRLLTGADANPATNRHGMGSEWNSLLYRVHSDIVDNGDNKQVGANWANMSDKEVGVNYEVAFNGSFSWCQEHYRAATNRVYRGSSSVSYFGSSIPTNTNTYSGWRPVLVRFL